MMDKRDDERSDKETAKVMEAALRRALITPPKKHEPKDDMRVSPSKRQSRKSK